MEKWAPTIVTALFVLVGYVWYGGRFSRTLEAVAEMAKETKTDLKEHKEIIWPAVNRNGEDIAKIKGHLGINGEFRKGHHV